VVASAEENSGQRLTTKNTKGKNMVRAKMQCWEVSQNGGTENIRLHAVTGGSDENKQWAKYTPCGDLTLSIDNPDAQGKFVQGKEYFIDITPIA
jgi:hypothetical protein